MSVSLQDILDDAPGEVDELDSIGGTPSQLPTKEFYHNNRDSLRQLRVRELRSEYVRLGGEESTVRGLNKTKVWKFKDSIFEVIIRSYLNYKNDASIHFLYKLF